MTKCLVGNASILCVSSNNNNSYIVPIPQRTPYTVPPHYHCKGSAHTILVSIFNIASSRSFPNRVVLPAIYFVADPRGCGYALLRRAPPCPPAPAASGVMTSYCCCCCCCCYCCSGATAYRSCSVLLLLLHTADAAAADAAPLTE